MHRQPLCHLGLSEKTYHMNNVDKILTQKLKAYIYIFYMYFRKTYDHKTPQTISSGVKI